MIMSVAENCQCYMWGKKQKLKIDFLEEIKTPH